MFGLLQNEVLVLVYHFDKQCFKQNISGKTFLSL